MRKQFITVFILAVLVGYMIVGCSSQGSIIRVEPLNIENEAIRKTVSTYEMQPDEMLFDYLDRDVQRSLEIFALTGIEYFYKFSRRVPISFEEYVKSEIPMIIPNDSLTGRPYHLVEEIDMTDSSGFTFKSDGLETCEFMFVVADGSGGNGLISLGVDSRNWEAYKTTNGIPGMFANVEYDFDKTKREYCIFFFSSYSFNFVEKYGRAPNDLKEMFKNQGELIEKGWEWTPDFESNEYLEFGYDKTANRHYFIRGSKSDAGSPMPVRIQDVHSSDIQSYLPEDGVNQWSFRSSEDVPTKILDKREFISTLRLHDCYEEIISG